MILNNNNNNNKRYDASTHFSTYANDNINMTKTVATITH